MTGSPLWRLCLALTVGAAVLLTLRATEPAAPSFLRCPTGSEGEWLRTSVLEAREGPAPAEALPAERRDGLHGTLFDPSGCLDGWLTAAASVSPERRAAPRPGFAAVELALSGVRPGEVRTVRLGGYPVLHGVRVLQVDGHVVDRTADGDPVRFRSPATGVVEVPLAEVAALEACRRLGALTTSPWAPEEELVGDCDRLAEAGPGRVAVSVRLGGVVPQGWYDLYAGVRHIASARVISVGETYLPGPVRGDDVRLDVSPAAAAALRACLDQGSKLLAQTRDGAPTEEQIGSCSVAPPPPTAVVRSPVVVAPAGPWERPSKR